jgi:hypothetical protein
MKRQIVIQGLVLIIMLIYSIEACSTRHPSVSASPVSAPHHDSVATSRKTGWTPQFSSGKWEYLIRDSSTISMTNDTTGHIEPIESTTTYVLSIADSNNVLILTGRIDSLLVNSRLPSRKSADTSLSREFHSVLSKQGHLTTVPATPTITCTGASLPPSTRLQELLITRPTGAIEVGSTWSDTSSMTTCHGKIPLTQTVVRNYQLMESSTCQPGMAQVQRTVSSSLIGSSAETNSNHLSANGSGTATSILCLDRNTGILLESTGHSHLEMTVTTSRGTFPFVQNTSTQIRLR